MTNYERKLRKIKQVVKDLVVENSSLVDSIANIQTKIEKTNRDRDFLLKKLFEYEPSSLDLINPPPSIESTSKYIKKRKNSDSESKPPPKKKQTQQIPKKANPQRLPMILTQDGITLYNLGKIIDRPAYHTETCIYPVGFKISRVYNGQNYICRILDNGQLPLFEIFKETNPNIRFVGSSSDDVHSELLQAVDSRSNVIIPDGDRFFGLKNRSILDSLSQQPAAKKLMKFNKVKKFENFFFDDNARFMSNSSMPDQLF